MAKLLQRFGSKKDLNSQELKCAIRLLDDEELLQTTFQREDKGQTLLDYVFKTLGLLEKDYFGLRFVDANNQRTWLDPTRLILKQVKGLSPIVFCFRVKYYPADPSQLKEEVTRYLLYLQLRRDILNRRLFCFPTDAIYLIAYVIQSELGDYNPSEHKDNYISTFKLIPNQNEHIEMEAIEIHQNELKGLTPADAELCFLERAAKQETYGIDPFPVKDHKRTQLLIGINYSGILVFQGNRKLNQFKWNELQKITYEGKMFIVHFLSNGKKNLLGFKCPNVLSCQNLWRAAVEQRYFFTMSSSHDIPIITTGGGLFSKQCKLRYSGRVEREILEDMKNVSSSGSSINRRHSMNSLPLSMRSIGRSNTAPLPNNESPDFSSSIYQDNKNPYLNYSTVSEPHGQNMSSTGGKVNANSTYPALLTVETRGTPNALDPFDEEEWEASMNSSLPTEFDMRPELTPTGEKPSTISFETPVVRSSPSQLSHKTSDEDVDSDETLEQVSEIVDQTPSTYQPKKDLINTRHETGNKKGRKVVSCGRRLCAMLCTSILSALIIFTLLSCLIVLVLETESDIFNEIRQLPEMVIFHREYYQPIKESILQNIS